MDFCWHDKGQHTFAQNLHVTLSHPKNGHWFLFCPFFVHFCPFLCCHQTPCFIVFLANGSCLSSQKWTMGLVLSIFCPFFFGWVVASRPSHVPRKTRPALASACQIPASSQPSKCNAFKLKLCAAASSYWIIFSDAMPASSSSALQPQDLLDHLL